MTSTKQFVWCDNRMCEARNGSGAVVAQYFTRGQTITGTSYLFTRDPLGSVREMTNSSGNIQAQYVYDHFGLVAKIQGGLSADFQYAGYYNHSASGLDFAVLRNYRPGLGRWLSRDPIGESGGTNLYDYVENCPLTRRDPSGMSFKLDCNDKPTDCPKPGVNSNGIAPPKGQPCYKNKKNNGTYVTYFVSYSPPSQPGGQGTWNLYTYNDVSFGPFGAFGGEDNGYNSEPVAHPMCCPDP